MEFSDLAFLALIVVSLTLFAVGLAYGSWMTSGLFKIGRAHV